MKHLIPMFLLLLSSCLVTKEVKNVVSLSVLFEFKD